MKKKKPQRSNNLGCFFSLFLFFFPLFSLFGFLLLFEFTGASLFLVNTPITILAGFSLWLQSRFLGSVYLNSVGHHCSYGDERQAIEVGVSRVSPIFPAFLSIIMILCTFWHILVAILLLLKETGTW